MENKNLQTLSNNNLKLYKMELENEFEKTKREIKEKMDFLDELDKEYLNVEKELNKRQGNIY